MKIPGMRRVKHLLRRLRIRCCTRGVVLCYHRVYEGSVTDPQLLCVSPKHFEEHLQIISKYFNPVSCEKLIADIKNKALKPRSLAITFDDGYFDNYEFALPLLKKYNIPATFFISSGYINNSGEFYWDELSELVLDKESKWNAAQNPCSCSEYKYANLTALMHYLSSETERQEIMNKLYIARGRGRPEMRRMTIAQIKNINASALFEIGSHSCNHLSLKTVCLERQKDEIKKDMEYLASIIGENIKQFCYPYGEYNQTTINLCKELHLTGAFSLVSECVTNNSNLYSIPRFLVRDWDKNKFKTEINHFYGF